MFNILLMGAQVLGVSAGGWAAYNTGSTGAFIQQPAFSAPSLPSVVSPLRFKQQPAAFSVPQYLDTSYSRCAGASCNTGAFVTEQPSWSALQTRSAPRCAGASCSTGAFVTEQPTMYISQQSAPATGYGYSAMESGSSTNPYNINMLNTANIAPITVQASKVMPVKKIMAGEQHVVENDLQMHVNHEADKTVFTKRLVHHSPVLHKTVRTHQIAQDVIHDKKTHHMNVYEDVVKQVPGQEYIGGEENVDHTVAQPNIASTGAFVQQPMASTGAFVQQPMLAFKQQGF